VLYSEWRTNFVNAKKDRNKNPEGKRVVYRLPTPDEFTAAYKLSINDPKGKTVRENWDSIVVGKGCRLFNFRIDSPCASDQTALKMFGNNVYPNARFFPLFSGIYDLLGNVAEITLSQGKAYAMGGSFQDYASQSYPPKKEPLEFDQTSAKVGFRCVAFYE
jgi:hypothetical protein